MRYLAKTGGRGLMTPDTPRARDRTALTVIESP
jgi:hypothetical protein